MISLLKYLPDSGHILNCNIIQKCLIIVYSIYSICFNSLDCCSFLRITTVLIAFFFVDKCYAELHLTL